MSGDVIKDRWLRLSGKLRKKWSGLTADDVNQAGGDRGYLVAKLQERYGIAREKADVQVKEFERTLQHA